MEKLAECCVCCDLEGPPKEFPCGHVLCLACVRKKHAESKFKATKKDSKKANRIMCPTCKKKVQIPDGKVDNLGTNYSVQAMQKAIRENEKRAEKVSDLCKRLDNNVAEEYCNDCRKFMCSACAEQHVKRKNSANHSFNYSPVSYCRQHEETFDYFCEECPRFLCDSCIEKGDCEGHTVKTIEDIQVEDVETELDEIIKQIKREITYNLEEHKPLMKTIKRKIDEAKKTKEVIKSCTERLIEMLRKEEQVLLKQVDRREDELEEMMNRLKDDDNLEVYEQLQTGAKEAKEKQNVCKMIMSVAAIRAKLPPSAKKIPDERVHIYVKYRPQEKVRVGDVYMYFDAPRVLWEKDGLGWGQDVDFTATGCLAVVDYSRTKVLLYDRYGEIVADSSEKGVVLKYPSSIIYHPDEDAILVADYKAGVVKMLNSHTLRQKEEIELENTEKPYGIAVLSNGFIVATQIGRDQKTSIHDISGRLVKEWRTYGENEEFKMNYPWYVAVDADDNILVSMDTPDAPGKRRHVAVYTSTGRFLKTVTVPEGAPWGLCGDDRGNILVTSFPSTLYHYNGEDMKILDYKTKCGNIRSIALQDTRIALMYNHGLQLCLFRPE